MPRLSPYLTRSTFFLFGHDPNGKQGEIRGPFGSGVIVGIYLPTQPTHIYAITAAHVLSDASIIRVNTKNGSRTIELDPSEWTTLHGIEDLAAVDITERIDPETDELSYIPLDMCVSQKFAEDVELGVGEDGFMLGLFTSHAGRERNLVAARFGNISLLPSADAPIPQERGQKSPCFVFDIHSRPGFSGSPVFVYRTPTADLRDIQKVLREKKEKRHARTYSGMAIAAGIPEASWTSLASHKEWVAEIDEENNTFLKLLGVHVGQFDQPVQIKKVAKNVGAESDPIRPGDTVLLPSSMTVVVPAWQIETLLGVPALKERRRTRNAAFAKKGDEGDAPI